MATAHALDRHLALVGFMGAGKTTTGAEVARRLDCRFVDLDGEIERRSGRTVADLFAEGSFRQLEAELADEVLRAAPAVVALGGGAIETASVRERLRDALVVLVDADIEEMWARVCASDRPLARDETEFRALYERRRPLYEALADATARDADDVVLAAAGVHVAAGSLERLAELVPGEGPVALVCDARVAGIHGPAAQLALGQRLAETHQISGKTLADLEALWRGLGIGRQGTVVALGGGTVSDVAGFAAATYMRGIDWIAVPTTLVGQVDAAIGGKTAIDLAEAKNLVGAFHWPARVVIDPSLLATLPEDERVNGLAEVVKTGVLAGEPLWKLPDPELVRRCAAYKAGLCLRDPHDRGPRRALNLGHTFAHALEAASGYTVPHGRAVALGLKAALALSGRSADEVDAALAPEPVQVDRGRAWQALLRDKKGALRIVLLGEDGAYETELPEEDVRRALDTLIL